MAASSSWLGILPASESLLALTMIMNRMFVLRKCWTAHCLVEWAGPKSTGFRRFSGQNATTGRKYAIRMATAPLNVAVLGLGWWGRIIVPLIKTSAKLRVVRVADPAPAAQGFAAEQGIPLGSFEDVLRDPAVQGVVLCTPHTQHTEQ